MMSNNQGGGVRNGPGQCRHKALLLLRRALMLLPLSSSQPAEMCRGPVAAPPFGA